MTGPKHRSYHKRRDLGSIYTVEGDLALPSVTSVLRMLSAPALTNWLENQSAGAGFDLAGEGKLEGIDREAAVKLIRATANATGSRAPTLGSRVHELIESGEEPPEALVPYISAAGVIVMGLGDFYASELTLVNLADGYAGTADLITLRGSSVLGDNEPGELTVLDWKSAKLGASVGWLNHIMQVVALAHCAHFINADDELELLPGDITEVIVAGLRPDGSSQMRSMTDTTKLAMVQQAFLGLLRNWELADAFPGLSVWESST